MIISGKDIKKMTDGTLKDEIRLLKNVWRHAHNLHLRILIPMVLQVVIGLFPATLTYYVQALLTSEKRLSDIINASDILIITGLLFGLTFVRQVSGMIQGYAMADVRRNLEQTYIRYLSRTQRLPGLSPDRKRGPGNRGMMALSKESSMLASLIPMVYRSFIQAPLTVISFLVLMIVLSWKLTIVVFILVGVVIGCCTFLRKKVKKTQRKLYDRLTDLFQIFSDRVKGSRVLRFYDTSGFLSGKLIDVVDDSCSLNKRLVKISSLQMIITELLTYFGVMVFVVMVACGEKSVSMGILLAYPLAILYIRSEIIKIINGYSQLTTTESAVRQTLPAFKPKIVRTGKHLPDCRIKEICLNRVSFSYERDFPVLRDCSISVKIGSINVIAGESGCGKSTMLDIISAAYPPDAGSVTFNGNDISDFSVESVVDRIAIVEQEPYLMEGSFLDNLTMGNIADTGKIIELCRKFNLSHIISSNKDLEKNVDDGGLNLSVGEKQRLVFIRALLKNPEVLLLDEATSAVDRQTSRIMMDWLRDKKEELLVILVSHEQEIISSADRVYLLSEGKIRMIE